MVWVEKGDEKGGGRERERLKVWSSRIIRDNSYVSDLYSDCSTAANLQNVRLLTKDSM